MMWTKQWTASAIAVAAMVMGVSAPISAKAGSVLIVTTNYTAPLDPLTAQNLVNLHAQAGNQVTFNQGTPGDISGYDQVWNINEFLGPTVAEKLQYSSYLAAGGRLALFDIAGPNTRIKEFVEALGGGVLSNTGAGTTQIVSAPFNGSVPVSSVHFDSQFGAFSKGAGQWITNDQYGGMGVFFAPGSLSGAPLGTMTLMFNINFMSPTAEPGSQALTRNLIGYLSATDGGGAVAPPHHGAVPEPATWAMMILGFGMAGAAMRRRDAAQSA